MLKTVMITGALGNLGWKATSLFAGSDAFDRVLACDLMAPSEAQQSQLRGWDKVEFLCCDFSKWQDLRWRGRILDMDAVVHFAAQNPFPEASWQDVAVSMDITNHIATALLASTRPQRLIFVSSNHVMGRYKDTLFGTATAAGKLRTDLEPGVGTVWHTGLKTIDSTGYATVKLAGERTCRAVTEATNGRISSVSVRIGWCQPGDNHPATLSAAGSITIDRAEGAETEDRLAETDRWFREMWLSNGDFDRLMLRAAEAASDPWPRPAIVVNGVSNNVGMVWSLSEAAECLSYFPQDNVYQHL